MPDRLTKEERHLCMSRIRATNTKPELCLRHSLWHMGFRYRINDKRLPGSPDIVLPKYRTVIFVNGCFWHGHNNCKIYKPPQTNTEFWSLKVTRNRERDQKVWRQLEAKGWSVIIVWECELEKAKYANTIENVSADIVANGNLYKKHQLERIEARKQRGLEKKIAEARRQTLVDEMNFIKNRH